jgi:hypothetical protein
LAALTAQLRPATGPSPDSLLAYQLRTSYAQMTPRRAYCGIETAGRICFKETRFSLD